MLSGAILGGNNRISNISVKACGKTVIMEDTQINTGCSEPTNIKVFTPGTFNLADVIEVATQAVPSISGLNVTNGTTYTYRASFSVRANSKLVDSIYLLSNTSSITYKYRWHGDCQNDAGLTSIRSDYPQDRVSIASLFGQPICDNLTIENIRNSRGCNTETAQTCTLHIYQNLELRIEYNPSILGNVHDSYYTNPLTAITENFSNVAFINITKPDVMSENEEEANETS